ncbi:OmpA/MotB domain protein [Conexibacter woesei DSM 14684]|uniref:OmpA/MotB domain protein n=2 Tax=Conexibacter TaxID=191494 RepID=D3FBM1_CONWI|nr:OmpA/MotB domain protein [Conexibacter woesei DSM 14684]
MTYLEVYGCPSGVGSQKNLDFNVESPTGESAPVQVDAVATRCLPNSATYAGEFDVPLDTITFPTDGAPDGRYVLRWRNGNRIAGIVNLANSDNGYVQFEAQVRKVTGQATAAPFLGSDVVTGIGRGSLYSQNLNASDADGGTLTYATRLKPEDPDAADADVVTLDQTGQVTIPAATTSTFAAGAHYIYKARVTDSQGDYAERDVLMRVAPDGALAPTIDGLSTEPYEVEPGQTRTIEFSASDGNAADTVAISASGLPAWATLETTPGNPARATLRLAPPAGLAPGTYGINFDAVDDEATTPLTGTFRIGVAVRASAPAAPTYVSAPAAHAATATFAFTGVPSATFECQLDGGAWTACTSPYTPTGLADGTHTLRVRQSTLGSMPSSPATHTWTLDTKAPAAPAVQSGPGATSGTTATFAFAGEAGATFSCRIDGGAWAPCASPVRFTGLSAGSHTFEVRQSDLAGNVSQVQVVRFTLGADQPRAPAPRAPVKPAVRVALGESIATGLGGTGTTVGCKVTGAVVDQCVVTVYAKVTVDGKTKLVAIGSGRLTGRGASRTVVGVKLNARGRQLVDRIGGVRAVFKIKATTKGGTVLRATRVARLLPARTIVIPSDGQFRVGDDTLLAQGRRYARAIAPQLKGVKRVTCTGHTDSDGGVVANRALGLARAKAVCAELRRLGVKAPLRTRSAGESRPRATNDTAQGRRLNRRVELTLSYR